MVVIGCDFGDSLDWVQFTVVCVPHCFDILLSPYLLCHYNKQIAKVSLTTRLATNSSVLEK